MDRRKSTRVGGQSRLGGFGLQRGRDEEQIRGSSVPFGWFGLLKEKRWERKGGGNNERGITYKADTRQRAKEGHTTS
jgi:hypothetical protein